VPPVPTTHHRTAAHHGQGVHVAHDGAGAEAFHGSLASLRYDGALAYDGQTIKASPTIDLLSLPKRVLVTYPVVQHDAT
jgi:NADPH:quinone reductase-like Zn-dependent oxidoreductase